MTVREFFAGQKVFITGGTGFIGKVLVEKLLRSCPEVDTIYLAIRPKKDVSVEKRWKELSELELFDKIKEQQPEALRKIKLVYCDLRETNIGLSDEDLKLLSENVTLVYHVAAAVQFNNSIIDTLIQNSKATYLLLELCRNMKKLQVFVHVSTTYTNFFRPRSQWGETLYPPEHDWRCVLKLLEEQPQQLAYFHEKLLGNHPNPYTFSKSLAEYIVADYHKYFTTLIVRPSVVMAAFEEPVIGWSDTLNGMAALWVGYSFGIVRVAHHGMNSHQDYVPVDTFTKFLIYSTKYSAERKNETKPLVYNCTFGKLKTIKSSDALKSVTSSKLLDENPSANTVWTRNIEFITNPIIYQLYFILYQLIPACILDIGLKMSGSKPMFIKIAKKLSFANGYLFKDFKLSETHFPNDKYLELERQLTGEDKKEFRSDCIENPDNYTLDFIIEVSYMKIREQILKEDLSEEATRRNKIRYERIKKMDRALKLFLYCSATILGYFVLENLIRWKLV